MVIQVGYTSNQAWIQGSEDGFWKRFAVKESKSQASIVHGRTGKLIHMSDHCSDCYPG